QADDVVVMRMREEQVHVVRTVGNERSGRLAQSGSGVEDQVAISKFQLNAGRIAAITLEFRAGYGDTSPHTPEFDLEFIVLHSHFDTDCRHSNVSTLFSPCEASFFSQKRLTLECSSDDCNAQAFRNYRRHHM